MPLGGSLAVSRRKRKSASSWFNAACQRDGGPSAARASTPFGDCVSVPAGATGSGGCATEGPSGVTARGAGSIGGRSGNGCAIPGDAAQASATASANDRKSMSFIIRTGTCVAKANHPAVNV